MDWLAKLDWNMILTVLVLTAFVVFMVKGGCGGMCGIGSSRKENGKQSEARPKEETTNTR